MSKEVSLRKDPSKIRTTITIDRELHKEVMRELIDLDDLNLSILAEQLLEEWLDRVRKSSTSR